MRQRESFSILLGYRVEYLKRCVLIFDEEEMVMRTMMTARRRTSYCERLRRISQGYPRITEVEEDEESWSE